MPGYGTCSLKMVIMSLEKASFCLVGQKLPTSWSSSYDRWYCDPPYGEENAVKMYGTAMPSISKLLTEGARVTKPGGLLFLLLGVRNMQWCPQFLTRIGIFFITILPNQEVRYLYICRKHSF
ncbi:MAG: hypothetical protein WA461_03985 [Nitrososphaeraceae archaeon]